MIYTINNKQYIHIQEFAARLGLTVSAIRHLCQTGGLRRMKFLRDGSRILIEVQELTEYPFVNRGRPGYMDVFHYRLDDNGDYIRELCNACTYKIDIEKCEEAKRLYSV